MIGNKTILFLVYSLLGAILSSVQANPVSRQVGLSSDVQVLTVNGTEVCQVGGQLYQPNDDLPTEDPCEYCTCQPPGFACEVIKCTYKPGCRSLQRAGLCCPEFICDCEYEGKVYLNGDRIKTTSNPCQDCYCITGKTICSIISCKSPPSDDCLEVPVEGECCPKYECPHIEEEEKEQEELKETTAADKIPVTEGTDLQPEEEKETIAEDEIPVTEGASLQPEEEKETTTEGKIPATEDASLQQEDSQDNLTGLKDAGFITTEIPLVTDIADNEQQYLLEEGEKTSVEASDLENSIFIQILPLQTTTVDQEEDPTVEPTESEPLEVVGETTESLISAEKYTTEKQPEIEIVESATVDEQMTSDTTTESVPEDEYLTQTSTLGEESAAESTEESISVSESESEVKTETSTIYEIYQTELTDISTTEVSDDQTEASTSEELFIDLTEKSSGIHDQAGTELPIAEETLLIETTEIPQGEQAETASVYQDSGSELTEVLTSETTISPTERSAIDEESTDILTGEDLSLTETTKHATTDDLLGVTTLKSDSYRESLVEVEFPTSTDISIKSATMLPSDKTDAPSTSNANEVATEFQEAPVEKLEDRYLTSALNDEVKNEEHADESNVVTKKQHASAPANKIEKSENYHKNMIHSSDEMFAAESEIVADEQPFVEASTSSTQEHVTTEGEYPEQTTELQNYEETTIVEQMEDGITTDISSYELTTEDNEFKSDVIELNEEDQLKETEASTASRETTTEALMIEMTDKEIIQVKSDEITTILLDEERMEFEITDKETIEVRSGDITTIIPEEERESAIADTSTIQIRSDEITTTIPDEERIEFEIIDKEAIQVKSDEVTTIIPDEERDLEITDTETIQGKSDEVTTTAPDEERDIEITDTETIQVKSDEVTTIIPDEERDLEITDTETIKVKSDEVTTIIPDEERDLEITDTETIQGKSDEVTTTAPDEERDLEITDTETIQVKSDEATTTTPDEERDLEITDTETIQVKSDEVTTIIPDEERDLEITDTEAIQGKSDEVTTTIPDEERTELDITDQETTQVKSDEITTSISDEQRRKEEDDYWKKMMMGQNNPIEVMKEIVKISEPVNKHESDSVLEETVTEEVIIPEDSTILLRSDVEYSESSSIHSEIEELTEKYPEQPIADEVELTTQYIEPREKSQENNFENLVTETEDKITTEISVDSSRLRQDTNENEINFSETETSSQLSEGEYTTEKRAADLENEDVWMITETPSISQDTATTMIREDIIKEYVTSRSEILTTKENEESVKTESIHDLDDKIVEEKESEEKKDSTDETKVENPTEDIKQNKTDNSLSSEVSNRKNIRKESNIHIFNKILSNGSVTRIQTHPSENKSGEKTERISHQIHHLARKYGLRPLTKRTYRDEIIKRRVHRQRDRKSLFKRRQ